jgi:hypothetical protein
MMPDLPVTFLYTNSFDTTADLLILNLGSEKFFRFNFDLWRDYRIYIDDERFEIENPTGLRICDQGLAKAYWRKPMRKQHMFPDMQIPQIENYIEEELWYAMRELVNRFWLEGKLVLTEPFADMRGGKLIQARIAKKYFDVPAARFVCGRSKKSDPTTSVVKSLTSSRVKEGAVIYTTRVRMEELDSSSPWYTQEFVEAEKDITVAFVRDQFFAFELPREGFVQRTIDWREVSLETATSDWPTHQLPDKLKAGIFSFMRDMGLHYGRLDFLYTQGKYVFLEVNSNGEWGWLDVEGKYGLRDKIAKEVSPLTPVHSVPTTRDIRLI